MAFCGAVVSCIFCLCIGSNPRKERKKESGVVPPIYLLLAIRPSLTPNNDNGVILSTTRVNVDMDELFMATTAFFFSKQHNWGLACGGGPVQLFDNTARSCVLGAKSSSFNDCILHVRPNTDALRVAPSLLSSPQPIKSQSEARYALVQWSNHQICTFSLFHSSCADVQFRE